MDSEKFFMATDNDSHWYVIPVAKADAWQAWLDLDDEDEEAWDTPDFALAVYGPPSAVTFENPLINIS